MSSEIIKNNFSKAALTYDGAADFQRCAASELLSFMREKLKDNPPPKKILELGCGTGLVTTELVGFFPNAEFTITDISAEMLSECKNKIQGSPRNPPSAKFAVLDISRHFDLGKFDLVVSGLTLQWVQESELVFESVLGNLAERGFFVFSTLGPESFHELKKEFREIGENYPVPEYPGENSLRNAAGRFRFCEIRKTEHRFEYASVHECMKTLKKLGTVNPSAKKVSPGKLRQILRRKIVPFTVSCALISAICEK